MRRPCRGRCRARLQEGSQAQPVQGGLQPVELVPIDQREQMVQAAQAEGRLVFCNPVVLHGLRQLV